MHFDYKTKGTCARIISLEINDGIVSDVRFLGGCGGNTQGVSKLVEGKSAQEIEQLLRGVDCNGRGTSCPDQLAMACRMALEKEKAQ